MEEPDNPNGVSCSGCIFFNPHRAITIGGGWCRRYPEHIHKNNIDWCGEFKPRISPPLTSPGQTKTLTTNKKSRLPVTK